MSEQEIEDVIVESPGEDDDEEVYVQYDIASYPSDLTLSVLHDMWKSDDIEIPEFQRNFVWGIRQSSLLIESFLLGLPVPQIFFYIDDRNKNLVIDGQQRILSVVYFLEGFFGEESTHGKKQVFRLSGLSEDSPFYRKTFKELDDSHKRRLRNAVLRAINIRQLSPRNSNTSIYHIFERLNTGGTPLKPQEIRNCVFRGPLIKVLKELNDDENWRKIIGKKTLDKHQKDVELVLRVFSLTGNWLQYEKPMKEFLNKSMEADRAATSKKVTKFAERFPEITAKIVTELGEKPFHIRGPLNTAALDSVMAILIENSSKIPANLRERYDELLASEEFTDNTYYGTSDVSVLHERFNLARDVLIG